MKKILLPLFILFAIIGPEVDAAQYNALKSITSGGRTRQFFLYVPDCLTANRPLIISCHGMEQDYQYQKQNTKWTSMADTANFVVAYPQGISGSAWNISFQYGWNLDNMTDVNFMLAIVDSVKAEYNIDDTRVYLSGFSLGGAFVYYAANKAADKFAAFASMSGYNLMNNNTTTSRPVPIVHIHGTADNIMPYSGVKDYLKKWAQAQNCNMTPIETTSNGYSCLRYKDGNCETEVVLYTVNGREHEPTDNDGFHTSNAIWAFCRQYSTACGKITSETALDESSVTAKATKRIVDGQLVIEKNGKIYDTIGGEVK